MIIFQSTKQTLQTHTLQLLPVAAISLPLNKLAHQTGIKIAPSRCAKSFINNYISATANGPPERGKAPKHGSHYEWNFVYLHNHG